MNFGSWAIVGLIFSYLVRRRAWAWWHKYNFVLSSALDCSVSIAGVIIFFAVFYSGASSNFKWWGTQVHKVGASFSWYLMSHGLSNYVLFYRTHVMLMDVRTSHLARVRSLD